MSLFEGAIDARTDKRYAIVAARWNPRIVDALVAGAQRVLAANGVNADAVDLVRVPGAWELPIACEWVLRRGEHVAIIAIGCVVRGDTRHYEQVADGCAQGLLQVSLEHGIAIANAVLAVEMHADAEARSGGRHGNKGEEAALVALEMASLSEQVLG